MCNNYIKTRDQKTVLELSRREAERKFNALFEYEYVDRDEDFLDQILVTFPEFKAILEKKANLLRQLLPNVYDYEKFFMYKTETDFIVLSEKTLPAFADYCRGVLKSASIKMDFLFPKVVLLRSRKISFRQSEDSEEPFASALSFKLPSSKV